MNWHTDCLPQFTVVDSHPPITGFFQFQAVARAAPDLLVNRCTRTNEDDEDETDKESDDNDDDGDDDVVDRKNKLPNIQYKKLRTINKYYHQLVFRTNLRTIVENLEQLRPSETHQLPTVPPPVTSCADQAPWRPMNGSTSRRRLWPMRCRGQSRRFGKSTWWRGFWENGWWW